MLPGIPPDPPVLVPAIAPPTPPTPIVFLYFCKSLSKFVWDLKSKEAKNFKLKLIFKLRAHQI